ncbi:sensor histidine kinase [Thalassotalea euphylliae]|uniref:histidine kinase n=1 Tax=Thalassotalea euphylliae TaxID=1655234 RepID=A0A3E0UI91_9GAMM|nr:ATP-binding protein [Thalassotalea euphylliae]REL36314.1 histidine kinase [Thalassotalea euphylliae]
MGFKQFSLRIISRTILAMVSLLLLSLLLSQPGYHAASILLTALLIAQLYELIRYVNKTNGELVRFFEAARHADYSQRFDLSELGTGFDELGQAFGDILGRLQQARNQKEENLRHLKAVVEHVPVPLISLVSTEKNTHNKLTLWNNSARRLFGTHSVTKLSDLDKFHPDFSSRLISLTPGERSLITIKIDDTPHQLSISATAITIGQQQELLISLQDIQSELDAAQLSAWQDLVRVLTHEIMNSITPVASLAKTAVDLVDDVAQQVTNQPELVEELNDVTDAVNTVARRSDGLMQFVTSYRRLTRLPSPNKQLIKLSEFFNHIERLACQHWSSKGVQYQFSVSPASLTLTADADMLEQVLINLLQNAEHAVAETKQAQVIVSASLNARGRVLIEVCDNGCGISEEVAEKIFVPFFTTKREGSGVGLALTRQIMLAHGGFISLANNSDLGCTFNLTF